MRLLRRPGEQHLLDRFNTHIDVPRAEYDRRLGNQRSETFSDVKLSRTIADVAEVIQYRPRRLVA